jgi:hypothetical protein
VASGGGGSGGTAPQGGGGGTKAGGGTGGASGAATGGQGGISGAAGDPGSGGIAGAGATGGVGPGGGGGSGGTTQLTCMQQLDQLGIGYTTTVAKGVVDGVKLTGKLNEVLFAKENTQSLIEDPIACEFVLHLWKLADVLKAHGIHRIGTLGSYCYRCCCYWSTENFCRGPNDPEPDCTIAPWQGLSNHSFGRALDIRWIYKDDGSVYDINDPATFVKWSNSSQTCGAALAAQTGISKELYSLACELSTKQVFGLILTPNYNSAHRNHFHCDIGQSGEPNSWQVLSSTTNVDSGDRCDD